jgi:hypothetical protein
MKKELPLGSKPEIQQLHKFNFTIALQYTEDSS